MPITTTLNRIREREPCNAGWGKLLAGLGKVKADDEPLPFAKIAEINGLDDALWCCQAEPQYAKEWRLFAVWCARRVQHLIKDQRSINAIDVAERYANGKATDAELDAARDAAWVVRDVAKGVAWAAARAANSATRAAASGAARNAASAAASAVSCEAEREAQKAEFLRFVTETEARDE